MEQESVGYEPKSKAINRDKSKAVLRVFFIVLILTWLIREMAAKGKPQVLWHIIFAIVFAVSIVLNLTPFFFQRPFGTIGLEQICSPEFEQRIRTRYRAETDQLTDLGFDHLFFVGDALSIYRLMLIFPAIVVFQMWLRDVPMTVQGGTKLLTGNPVFISRDKSAYAHPNSLGVTFHTAFQDGTLLVSKNFGDDTGYIPQIEGNSRPGASMSSTWAAHQERLQTLETEGKRVDRQTSFQAYAEIVRKEQTSR